MNEATPIKPNRTVVNLLDELNLCTEGICTVGTLLGEVSVASIPAPTVSAAGYLIVRMADEAKAISRKIGDVNRGAS